ncbi:hypothetical protein MesoLjLc_21990 [Mesorhizobium sp. L-8-10]|uniref:hypothetical protein n=1 Tax=unclassified Mesorhizobium TaxID=325217 RepID=UPI00192660CB|nr:MULTISPECIES: hypothetical protein [unclassified Mesorhizobium]BCH22455.1 hypothetical protein MesoLjLb_22400 [Mesorhizobium sp. L-8-3]BCH30269.1 hypothetical protein MesoLjLc_21990 [Mesorhizobium sp. L-8-10]
MPGRKKTIAGIDQGREARAAVDTVRLVRRLQQYALGDADEDGDPVELDASQLKVIEMLLKKTLPDLANVSLAAPPEKAFEHPVIKIVREIVDPRDPI